VSRLTKQIRLVLISSSLALASCGRQPQPGVGYQQVRPGGPNQMPPVCGPVDGQPGAREVACGPGGEPGAAYGSSGAYQSNYYGPGHYFGHHYWGWGGSSSHGSSSALHSGSSSTGVGRTSSGFSGHSGSVSSRGGFGSSGHGVSS
jgi:hypothetical protein